MHSHSNIVINLMNEPLFIFDVFIQYSLSLRKISYGLICFILKPALK
jgi:hypothetical protein